MWFWNMKGSLLICNPQTTTTSAAVATDQKQPQETGDQQVATIPQFFSNIVLLSSVWQHQGPVLE